MVADHVAGPRVIAIPGGGDHSWNTVTAALHMRMRQGCQGCNNHEDQAHQAEGKSDGDDPDPTMLGCLIALSVQMLIHVKAFH
eukprot:CAMPEP_0172817756 /NCGR_PEP_ID=MMETSP1075-20121228/13447_1 /TAXON_ID=2916 /ORGANISM="Ceratium fusus, Strain PA161109" /LENGTH=82 /DNA_ID=CAMNT_0013658023 /DNA_START=123 /DNA_END=368 /DNA_ORIENTATION=+